MPTRSDSDRYGSSKRHNLLGVPVHRAVFLTSATLILTLVAFGVAMPERLEAGAGAVQDAISENLGWFYLLAMNAFLILALYLIFSRYGNVRLGGEDERPEFSTWGWFSMLFAAGTGVGLLFYGVAEPVTFFADPPFGEAETEQAASDALVHSYFHWGLHGWSMYGLVGLSLCYFCFNRGLPLTIRSAFMPLLGSKRVEGPIGNGIDAMAATGTLIGVAVSLGLGVRQINTGLGHAYGIPDNIGVQIALIAGITTVALLSVLSGLAKGIQQLSKLAMLIGAALVVYVLLFGPTQFILNSMLQSFGNYINEIPSRGTFTEAFNPPDAESWQNEWTLFYFAWWISWSPFVGLFIARVSRGRTLRQYLLGVLLVPTLTSVLWLTVMGGSALYRELFEAAGLVDIVEDEPELAFFLFLDHFQLPEWVVTTSMTLMIATVAIFFITSSDSGSLIIDIITSGGDPHPPRTTRVFWAILEGVVAAVLLTAGGLEALQAVATISGLPFVVILLLMCAGLYLGLRRNENGKDGQASSST
ncbi:MULTISPECIES: BCCT family transporter [Halomonadaceae]|uniref:BCCT family transporter n=1 Tax=Billgrantia aerodenitrificans TaxID=2733483 RepID=A0ABS9AU16_9GAMM|nr:MULTISPECIES: BCCT family transporter [Halomonas]MCE8025187.1 BCCT family transporter [Halomonas aerodenitrificans]MCE8040204.1 BCCT family transporter [Halomonas sp. MCCC 1A11062]